MVGRSATARRLAILGLGAGLLAGIWIATSPTATAQRPAPGAGDPGFHLVDAAGSPYSLESFPPDAVVVIYFGYTTCLRACPTTLNDIAEALDSLGSDGALVTPMFIDMDPDRAALVSLPLYMQSFGPRFLGLTGTPDAVAKAAKAFDVQLERLQFSSDPERLCDAACLADLRDAGGRSPSRVVVGRKSASGSRGRHQERTRTTAGLLIYANEWGPDGGLAARRPGA